MTYRPWIVAIIGIWLIAAPFVLGYANTELAMQNDVGVGVVTLIGSLFWGLSDLSRNGFRRDMQAQR
jgi:hypothetical protein